MAKNSVVKRDSDCTRCRLHETAEFVCLLGKGPTPCEAMFIGEAPGRREDDSGIPFVGKGGHLLDDILEELGWPRSEIHITNAVHCRPPDNRTPSRGEINQCKYWLEKEIKAVKPKYILLMGNVPLQAVLNKKGITKLQGMPIEEKNGIIYFPTFHPAYVLRNPQKEPTLRTDIKTFKGIVDNGGLFKEKHLNYKIVIKENIDEALQDISRTAVLAIDTETSGLNPFAPGSWVTSLGIGTRKYQWCFPLNHHESPIYQRFKAQQRLIKKIDRAAIRTGKKKTIVMHHGQFDTKQIAHHFGIWWYCDFDTMLADYNVDENRNHGLKFLCSHFFDAIDYDIPLEEKWGITGSLERHCEYLALDVSYTRRLYFTLKKKLKEDQLTHRLFKVLTMPVCQMYTDVEYHGIYVDPKKLDEANVYWTKKSISAKKKLDRLYPSTQKWKNKKTKEWETGVNWGSPKQLAEILFDELKLPILEETAKGAASTNESVLLRLSKRHKIPKLVLKLREADKNRNTFIEPWMAKAINNRLHPSFKVHGTVCVTADTLFLSNRGYIRLDELDKNDLLISHRGRPQSILYLIDNGIQPCLEIQIGGRKIRCTYNHPFLTNKGWVKAKDLIVGEKIKVLGSKEQWEKISEWPYEISSWGRVRHNTTKLIKRLSSKYSYNKKYLKVTLSRDDSRRPTRNRKDFSVHRLVAQAFISNPNDLPEIRHTSGIGWVNVVSNLSWGTKKDNADDMKLHGKGTIGKTNQKKITKEQVIKIRKDCRYHRIIAQEYGISRRVVGRIKDNSRRIAEFRETTNTKIRFIYSRVSNIKDVGDLPTYGVEVKADHSHITSGIVTHNTGRPSAEDPNPQQTPRDPRIRSIITAPKGWTLVSADYSQIELRLVADASQDPEMMLTFQTGGDIHTLTVQRSFGILNPTEAERKKGKAINFGYIYGMWWRKFKIYARDKFGIILTDSEAKRSRTSFFRLYCKILDWHTRQRRFAHINGYVRSIFGRKRRLPDALLNDGSRECKEAERQAINSPIQGAASDLTLGAAVELHEKMSKDKFHIVSTTHDEILMEIRNNYLDEALPIIKDTMENSKLIKELDICLSVPLVAEIKIGPWGSGVEWKA